MSRLFFVLLRVRSPIHETTSSDLAISFQVTYGTNPLARPPIVRVLAVFCHLCSRRRLLQYVLVTVVQKKKVSPSVSMVRVLNGHNHTQTSFSYFITIVWWRPGFCLQTLKILGPTLRSKAAENRGVLGRMLHNTNLDTTISYECPAPK